MFGDYTRLRDNHNGTVTDLYTGLMWQQETASRPWVQAVTHCDELTLAGYDDWRLPSWQELQSLVDYDVHNPSIESTLFPGTAESLYWSTTGFAANSD